MSKARARATHSTPPARRAAAAAPRDWLRWGSLALAVLGALDSAYLTYVKLFNAPIICGPSAACETVNTSAFAEFQGIPIAVLGLGAYMVLIGLLLLEKRALFLATWGPVAVFGLALTGTLYSAYLTYVELYILHAVCPYCVASALFIAGILVLSVIRLARGPAEPLDD